MAAATVAGASAQVTVDEKGMTLYTYDKDTKGAAASACTGGCAANWPPYVAATGAAARRLDDRQRPRQGRQDRRQAVGLQGHAGVLLREGREGR